MSLVCGIFVCDVCDFFIIFDISFKDNLDLIFFITVFLDLLPWVDMFWLPQLKLNLDKVRNYNLLKGFFGQKMLLWKPF